MGDAGEQRLSEQGTLVSLEARFMFSTVLTWDLREEMGAKVLPEMKPKQAVGLGKSAPLVLRVHSVSG